MFVACSRQTTTDGVGGIVLDSAALKIAVMPTLDCLPLYVAEASGMFDDAGLTVQLVPYTAQMDCDTAIERGRVEAMMTDLVRAERLDGNGTALSYATSTNLHWQLMSNKTARIRQLKQLDDKMLAMTRYSATALLADEAVESAQLKTERVFRIQVNDVVVRLSMLEANIMDALFLPEPQATQARNLNAYVLTDTRQSDVCLGVMAFSEQALKDTARVSQKEKLMKIYDQACDSINQHGLSAYRELIEKYCRVKSTTVDSMPDDIRFTHVQVPRQQDIDRARAWLKKQ